jgi:tRNA (guanine26-N2/guanine27-N2)-dimethyltransferase
MRKYWATPLRNELMHETGLRILIRRVQLIAATMEKAALPVFSYFKEHYIRAYFKIDRGGRKADEVIKKHLYFYYCNNCLERDIIRNNLIKNCGSCGNKNISIAGQLWTGKLWDKRAVNKILDNCGDEKTKKFLNIIAGEAKINSLGFYDIHRLCKKMRLGSIPTTAAVIKKLKAHYPAAITHFSSKGIRTTASIKEIKKFINAATER